MNRNSRTISKLSAGKGECWTAVLDDGKEYRIGEEDVLRLGLYEGRELDEASSEELSAAAVRFDAKQRAVGWLSGRLLSRREIQKRLVDRKVPAEDIDSVCDWLERIGLLNDAEYAVRIAETYSRKGYGERRIRAELYKRGVPREYWDDVLGPLEEPDETVDRLVESRLKGEYPDAKELKRTQDYLIRRGFTWEQVSSALRRYADRLEDES